MTFSILKIWPSWLCKNQDGSQDIFHKFPKCVWGFTALNMSYRLFEYIFAKIWSKGINLKVTLSVVVNWWCRSLWWIIRWKSFKGLIYLTFLTKLLSGSYTLSSFDSSVWTLHFPRELNFSFWLKFTKIYIAFFLRRVQKWT